MTRSSSSSAWTIPAASAEYLQSTFPEFDRQQIADAATGRIITMSNRV